MQDNKNMSELFTALLSTLQSLTRLIEKENKLLSQGENTAISKLLDQKEELIIKLQDIENKIKISRKDEYPQDLNKLDEKVKTLHTKLQIVMHDNEVLLKSKVIVSNKIIELYKTKHLQKALSQFGYNKNGVLPALQKLEKVMPSLSLNDKI
jgi:flagellar biosynthesis/type III secretory pathway chaperone